MILFIGDLIGLYQGSLNLKSTRTRNFEWLHNWSKLQVCTIIRETIQNANFEQRGPTPYIELLVFFWFRMVPYVPDIDVPSFPRFFSWKVAFLQHSNVHLHFHACFQMWNENEQVTNLVRPMVMSRTVTANAPNCAAIVLHVRRLARWEAFLTWGLFGVITHRNYICHIGLINGL